MCETQQWRRIQSSWFPVEEQGGCEARSSHRLHCNSPSPAALAERQKAESAGNRLLHFRISLSDKLIYTLKHRRAALCHWGLRGRRFHSSQRRCWRISLSCSSTVADTVLICDISCDMAFDCYNNLECPHHMRRSNPANKSSWYMTFLELNLSLFVVGHSCGNNKKIQHKPSWPDDDTLITP